MSNSRPSKLGDFLTIDAAMVDPTAAAYRDLPHVSGENIEAGSGRLLPVQSAHQDGMTSGKYHFDAGTLLYSKIRPYLKKAVVAPFRGLCSADIYPVRVDPEQADRNYVHWLLLSPGFTRYADECSRRARMPKLNREQLFAYPVQLPSPHEQKRLAAKLSVAMSEVACARAATAEQVNATAALDRAVLDEAFGGEEWNARPLKEFADVQGGVQKSQSRGSREHQPPYLTVRNVLQGELDLTRVETFEVSAGELRRLRMGDLLIVEGNGSPDQIGRNALFDIEDGREWVHQNHIIRVRVDRTIAPTPTRWRPRIGGGTGPRNRPRG